MIDAEEEIIRTLLDEVGNDPNLEGFDENQIRNLITLLINTQFDNDLKKTQEKMRIMIENILDMKFKVVLILAKFRCEIGRDITVLSMNSCSELTSQVPLCTERIPLEKRHFGKP